MVRMTIPRDVVLANCPGWVFRVFFFRFVQPLAHNRQVRVQLRPPNF
jgi:hypothetical protein